MTISASTPTPKLRHAAEYATELEVWRNDAKGGTGILKIDPLGNVRGERLQPGQVTTLTPYERRINHDKSATDKLDPFLNGRLTAIRLLDSEPDTEVLKVNPNSVTEADVKGLFKLKAPQLKTRLDEISNEVVLERLQELAEGEDASIAQVKVITERIEAVKEKPRRVRGAANEDDQGQKTFNDIGFNSSQRG